MNKKYFLSLVLLFSVKIFFAQEFNAFGLFGKGNPLKLNGGINAVSMYNYSSDPNSNPFNLIVGGNLNLNVKGFDVPLSFTYSNAKISSSFQPIPFNKFSIHPKYKNYTLHLGTVNKTFTQYTLNGFQFNGAALDYEKDKLKLTILGGNFLKASGNYNLNPILQPSYSRVGEGVAATYQFSKGINIGANIFHAKDNQFSSINIPIEEGVFPKENLLASLTSIASITPSLSINVEYANNLLTSNMNDAGYYTGHNGLSKFIRRNNTTNNKHALNSTIAYKIKNIDLGVEYENVDVNYESLGSLYTLNGFENTTFNISVPLLQNKIFLNAKIGSQTDLVDTVFSQKSGRILTIFSFYYRATNKFTISGNYNNNKTVTNFRNLNSIETANKLLPYFLDSLRLVQLNENASINANYQLKTTENETSFLTTTYVYQKGGGKQGDFFIDEQGSGFNNASAYLFTTYPKKETRWNVGVDYTYITQGASNYNSKALGFNFNFGKKFFKKKLDANIGSGYNSSFTSSNASRVNVVNFKLGANYTLLKKHVLNLNSIFQSQNRSSNLIPSTSRYNGYLTLSYNYKF